MNVLLVGAGGREHALAWKLKQSPELGTLFSSSVNAGILALAEEAPVDPNDHAGVVRFCRSAAIGLAVIGPEAPLVAGLASDLRRAGVAAFGPSAAAAQLEASKSFTKAICQECDIPAAPYAVFTGESEALAYARMKGAPMVVKADGLAAGKGVHVSASLEEAETAIRACFTGAFGEAGTRVLIEDKLDGEEASFFAICDGMRALPLATAKDYKRAFDGDEGPNTGGMGAVSPAPGMRQEHTDFVMERMVLPTLRAMAARRAPFRGVLYAGLMLTAEGPKLIEYNVRFGDPECQALMPRLRSDLLPVLLAAAKGDLGAAALDWSDEATVAIVMATKGYPGAYAKGEVIHGLECAAKMDGVTIFHAGTRRDRDGNVVADGGRVLDICALGRDVPEARGRAYRAAEVIDWPGGFIRRDIGAPALRPPR